MIKFVSDLRQVGCFLLVVRSPPPIKLTPRYNLHIVESGVKHLSSSQVATSIPYCTVLVYVVIHICENECSLLSGSVSVMEYYYLAFQPFDLEP